MHKRLFTAAATAASFFLLSHPGQASVLFTDNAGNYSSATGYAGQGGSTPGFGAFGVTATGSAGTFLYSAKTSEGNNGTPAPSTIDTPATATSNQPQSFGLFANNNNGAGPSSVTITRAFSTSEASTGIDVAGDSFSLDFVGGYGAFNGDAGSFTPNDVGVSLTDGGGTVGSFIYNATTGHYDFNGTDTGIGFTPGALHLDYSLTSATAYTLAVTGASTYNGTDTFSSPITGFEVQQANAGIDSNGDHNAYFNNLSLTANGSPAPEPSEIGTLALIGLGLTGLMLKASKRDGSSRP